MSQNFHFCLNPPQINFFKFNCPCKVVEPKILPPSPCNVCMSNAKWDLHLSILGYQLYCMLITRVEQDKLLWEKLFRPEFFSTILRNDPAFFLANLRINLPPPLVQDTWCCWHPVSMTHFWDASWRFLLKYSDVDTPPLSTSLPCLGQDGGYFPPVNARVVRQKGG